MKKLLSVVLAAGLILSLLAGCGQKEVKEEAKEEIKVEQQADKEEAAPEEDAAVEDKGELLMATTTSTADTGLLDYLVPIFKEDTGYTLKFNAVGTGEAIKMGENGDVDVILVHAKASEEEFVSNGFGVERFPVMYNDFVVVGPAEPIAKSEDISAVFNQINEEGLAFLSRGDDSGTDKKERAIWKAVEVDPSANAKYTESGQGMGATLTIANETGSYCLTDRGTWLKMSTDADIPMDIVVVCEADKNLLNQYGVIAVNPEKHADTNIEGANTFIEWITSEKVQGIIAEFGVDKYGQSLFTPNAGTDN